MTATINAEAVNAARAKLAPVQKLIDAGDFDEAVAALKEMAPNNRAVIWLEGYQQGLIDSAGGDFDELDETAKERALDTVVGVGNDLAFASELYETLV
jgi:hypothetical protein